ncbi:hypothetical protein A1E_03030 [Rickettsia canadensis str. McKiel]|uniref:Uncharacterized protein n=1 Tax=Rickettsia canadensis (strain McKiel) TaxID=293613 RepID=A8EYW3_RICCK|nr:hypothetical protein [Rickettsia canadensis]ABV73546.1 hypothetical protein A1E_03030 [Rickettsia canadensis str. McKiel]
MKIIFQTNERETKTLSCIYEQRIKEPEIIKPLLPAISKLSPEKMIEQGQGSKIVKDFAPLLESSNPGLVNGTKKALTELDPEYLAEYAKNQEKL